MGKEIDAGIQNRQVWSIGIHQVFYACWGVLFVIISCLSIVYYRYMTFSMAFRVCLIVATCAGMLFLYGKIRERFDKEDRLTCIFAACLFTMLFSGLLLAGRAMLIYPSSDSGTVWYSVADIVETGTISKEINEYTSCYWFTKTSNHNYFLIYPNTRSMVAYILPYCRLMRTVFHVDLRGASGYFCGALFNSVSITASVLFAFFAARKEKGNAAAIFLLLMSILFLPFYLNVYRVYSDTLSMPYVTLTIWLVILADHELRPRRSYGLFLAAGLSAAIGIVIKGSLWVLVVACLIYRILRNRDGKKTLTELAFAAVGLLLITQTWAVCAEHLPWLDTAEADRYELPTMHWIYMASGGNGGFDEEETEYMLSLDSVQDRKEAAITGYTQRVREAGIGNYLIFTGGKVVRAFSDGTFSQRNYLDRQKGKLLGPLITSEGEYYNFFVLYTSTFLFFLYTAIAVSAMRGIVRKEVSASFLFHLCMFGLALFFSFWEVKARYLLNYTPMFLLLATFSLDEVIEKRACCIREHFFTRRIDKARKA